MARGHPEHSLAHGCPRHRNPTGWCRNVACSFHQRLSRHGVGSFYRLWQNGPYPPLSGLVVRGVGSIALLSRRGTQPPALACSLARRFLRTRIVASLRYGGKRKPLLADAPGGRALCNSRLPLRTFSNPVFACVVTARARGEKAVGHGTPRSSQRRIPKRGEATSAMRIVGVDKRLVNAVNLELLID